jgi:hypothetical protein
MNAGDSTGDNANPAETYYHALQLLRQAQAKEQRREVRLGYSKLVVAALTLISAFFLFRIPAFIELLAVPVLVFVVLAVLQEKLIRRLRLRARSIQFYEYGMARLEDRWPAAARQASDSSIQPIRTRATWISLVRLRCSNYCARRAPGQAKRRWPPGYRLLRQWTKCCCGKRLFAI